MLQGHQEDVVDHISAANCVFLKSTNFYVFCVTLGAGSCAIEVQTESVLALKKIESELEISVGVHTL